MATDELISRYLSEIRKSASSPFDRPPTSGYLRGIDAYSPSSLWQSSNRVPKGFKTFTDIRRTSRHRSGLMRKFSGRSFFPSTRCLSPETSCRRRDLSLHRCKTIYAAPGLRGIRLSLGYLAMTTCHRGDIFSRRATEAAWCGLSGIRLTTMNVSNWNPFVAFGSIPGTGFETANGGTASSGPKSSWKSRSAGVWIRCCGMS